MQFICVKTTCTLKLFVFEEAEETESSTVVQPLTTVSFVFKGFGSQSCNQWWFNCLCQRCLEKAIFICLFSHAFKKMCVFVSHWVLSYAKCLNWRLCKYRLYMHTLKRQQEQKIDGYTHTHTHTHMNLFFPCSKWKTAVEVVCSCEEPLQDQPAEQRAALVQDHITARAWTGTAALLWFSDRMISGRLDSATSVCLWSAISSTAVAVYGYKMMIFKIKWAIYPEFCLYTNIKCKVLLIRFSFFFILKFFLRFSCYLLNLILHMTQDF